MKKSNKMLFKKIHFLSLAILFFFSCQNEEECLPVYDITGEWLSAYNDDNKISISAIEFTSEGVYKKWDADISRESTSNLKYEGTYCNNGKLDIVYTIKDINIYYPRQFHEVWRIVNHDKYMLHIYDETARGEYNQEIKGVTNAEIIPVNA